MRTILPDALVALGREHPELELIVIELDPAAAPTRCARAPSMSRWSTTTTTCRPSPTPRSNEPLLEEAIYSRLRGGRELRSRGRPGRAATRSRGCRDAPWIVGSPDTLCHAMAVRACQAAGFTPRIRHHADDFATVLALVAAGQGVALVPQLGATGAAGPPGGVALTPLPTRRRTRIAYRSGTRDQPPVAACAAAIRTSARALGLDVPGTGSRARAGSVGGWPGGQRRRGAGRGITQQP